MPALSASGLVKARLGGAHARIEVDRERQVEVVEVVVVVVRVAGGGGRGGGFWRRGRGALRTLMMHPSFVVSGVLERVRGL